MQMDRKQNQGSKKEKAVPKRFNEKQSAFRVNSLTRPITSRSDHYAVKTRSTSLI